RDHLESQEDDHRASYAPDRGLQKRRQANTVFREISGAAQFSIFSTASVIRYRSLRHENRSMSAMPRQRRLAVKASPVAMGQERTPAVHTGFRENVESATCGQSDWTSFKPRAAAFQPAAWPTAVRLR